MKNVVYVFFKNTNDPSLDNVFDEAIGAVDWREIDSVR